MARGRPIGNTELYEKAHEVFEAYRAKGMNGLWELERNFLDIMRSHGIADDTKIHRNTIRQWYRDWGNKHFGDKVA